MMKKIFHNTIMNKVMLGLLGVAMSVIAAGVISMDGSQVLAATGGEVFNDSTYKDYLTVEYDAATATAKINAKVAPNQPKTSGCEDWLFAGWYQEVKCETAISTKDEVTEVCFAKFVPRDVLSVKCQATEGTDANSTDTNLRFITSIDTDQYRYVGFEISRPGKVYPEYKTQDAFKRIEASAEAKVEYKYSPKVIDTKSEAFVTYTITGIPNTEENRYFDTLFMAKPYWVTLDGTKVYGVTRYVKVSDFYNNVVNIPVQVEPQESYTSSEFTVKKYTNATTSAAVESSVVAVYYNPNEKYAAAAVSGQTGLPSATKYEVTHNDVVTTCVHRNLLTKYTGSGTADRTWYDVDSSASEFVIATSADLYGFAGVANSDNQTFASKKIYLVADILVNKGKPTSTGWDTTGIEGGTNHAWIPVGNGSARIFGGTFDGQGHTISGLRQTGTLRIALFGWAGSTSVIQNFRLTNSYFESTDTADSLGGSIVGRSDGLVKDVYSDAVVKCAGTYAGGIVGYGQGSSNITNCQYAGTIYASGNLPDRVGGIIGFQKNGSASNCLFSGEIEIINKTNDTGSVTEIAFGGIYGRIEGTVNISNCLSIGKISTGDCTLKLTALGHVIGIVQSSATVNVSNLYYVNKSDDVTLVVGGNAYRVYGDIESVNESDITGLYAYYNKILVNTTDSAWVPTTGTPELKIFAQAPLEVNEPNNINLEWYTGIADEYTICNETDTEDLKLAKLRGFAYLVNVGITFKDKTVYLGADVDMNEGWTASATPTLALNTWDPIGTTENEFEGTFDGAYHSIQGVYIKTSEQGAGLFRSTAEGSRIKNLKLENSYVESTYGENWAYAGSIVGLCGGHLESVYSKAYVKGASNAVGGLVGVIWHGNSAKDAVVTFQNCWFDGSLNAKGNSGGFVGVLARRLTMTNCLNTGSIDYDGKSYVGGFCGRTFRTQEKWDLTGTGDYCVLTLNNCLNAGQMENGSSTNVGSIVGYVQVCTLSYTNVYTTYESYVYTSTEGEATSKDVGGKHSNGTLSTTPINFVTHESITGTNATSENFAPLGTDAWVQTASTPVLSVFQDCAPTIDVAWYEGDGVIDTRAELLGLSCLSQTQSINKNITLGADIDLNPGWIASENSGRPDIVWSSVGNKDNPFKGTFDGNGYTISGVYVDDSVDYMGFFGVTDYGSTITDFRIENSYFNQQIAGNSSKGFTASVVGQLRGNLSNVYSDAIVKSNNVRVGGLVACIKTQDKTEALPNPDSINITNCWFDGTVIGGASAQYLGGIVSTIEGRTCNMQNVLFTGKIESEYAAPSGATGDKTAVHIGGIVADAKNMTLSLESVVSAGSIINRKNHSYVNAVVARMRDMVETETPNLSLQNVFATRDCAETVYGTDGKTAVTGIVVRTTGDDRLIGVGNHEVKNSDGTSCILDFTQWSMRKDSVPIPAYFSDMDRVKDTVMSGFTDESLASEIGLDYWNSDAKITNAVSYGAGNYLVTYSATKAQYDEYLKMLRTKVGTQTSEGYAGLGFSNCITNEKTAMATDGVYASTCYKEATTDSGEWVLNITYVAKEDEPQVYISVHTDIKTVAPTLNENNSLANPSELGTSPISLSMLEMVNTHDSIPYGNSFVFELPNGHFIVSDGGRKADGEKLVEYLRDQAGTGKDVIIDAWIITHYHDDHCGALNLFFGDSSWRENIYLEAVYACEPSSYALGYLTSDQQLGVVNNALRGARALTKKSDGTKPDVYQLHMGQRYYFYGLTMDVIDTQEQHHVSTWGNKNVPDAFNTSSTNCVFSFKDTEGNTKKVLLGGDATTVNMEYIMKVYGTENETLSNIDVFAAYHHGHNTTATYGEDTVDVKYNFSSVIANIKGAANYDWANFLLNNQDDGGTLDAVLFSYSQIYEMTLTYSGSATLGGRTYYYKGVDGNVDYPYNIGDINNYMASSEFADKAYTYQDGTVKITFDGNNTTKVFGKGIFTEQYPLEEVKSINTQ